MSLLSYLNNISIASFLLRYIQKILDFLNLISVQILVHTLNHLLPADNITGENGINNLLIALLYVVFICKALFIFTF